MASIEPLVKRLKPKKTRIKFEIPEDLENESINSESNQENRPLINANEFEPSTNINGIKNYSNYIYLLDNYFI